MSRIGYCPPDRVIWDFWVSEVDGTYHLFHLQAPAGTEPSERHHCSSVGHAVSTDLREWTDRGTILEPSADRAAWDSLALWTGWTLERDGRHYLFYTGRSRRDPDGHTQRIGVATSTDLRTWKPHPANPVLPPDDRYAGREETVDGTVPWRDPCIVRDPESGTFYAFVTARDPDRPPGRRGCIARARSADLVEWEVLPPAASPGRYREMEVPSLHRRDGRWYLLFSVQASWYADHVPADDRQTGVRYLVADALDGDFAPPETDDLLLGSDSRQYTGRVVPDPDGRDVFLTWNAGPELGHPDAPNPYSLAPPRDLRYGERGGLGLD
ncbi:glycoside hydrolase family 68 protein [Halomarina halobia]|uniref:beta-fructofuranosidase n=1 Tax=Halomarina halobia TaxID=3033386 RepID=A0ABD6AAG2_9EURY|nr:glycoside hydrolase family 68 protein [Halomarina sp. PSR21]